MEMSITCPRPVLLPLIQREENSHGRVHRRGEIGDRHSDLGGLIGIAGRGDDSGFALDEQVVGFHIAVGAVLTVAGKRNNK